MKKVVNCIYVHKSAIHQLGENANFVEKVIKIIDFPYDIIKFDTKTKNITLVQCEEFDKVHEPIVGDCLLIKYNEEKVKLIKSKGQIYHKKYLFVDKDYTGFDIEAEKNRAEKYDNMLKKHPDKKIKSKIGYKNKWLEVLKWLNMEE